MIFLKSFFQSITDVTDPYLKYAWKLTRQHTLNTSIKTGTITCFSTDQARLRAVIYSAVFGLRTATKSGN